jgi:KUP system potassium uptake protein
MWTWRDGQRGLASARARQEGSPGAFLDELAADGRLATRAPQTAVFLTDDKDVAPFALRAVVEAAQVLPERVVLLSWTMEDTPAAPAHEALVDVDTFGHRCPGVVAVSVRLGYRERLSVQHVLDEAKKSCPEELGDVDPRTATYFLSDSIPSLAKGGGMAIWRQRVFLVLSRLTTDRVDHLELPRDRTIVIGREYDL